MDLSNYIQLTWPLAYGLTYMLHSTVWILLVATLVQIPLFQGVQIRHYLWKVALLGGLFTSTLVQLNKTDLLAIPLINNTISAEKYQEPFEDTNASLNKKSNASIAQVPINKPLNKVEILENGHVLAESLQATSITENNQIVESPTTPAVHHFLLFYINYFLLFWLVGIVVIALKLSIQHWLYFKNIETRLPVEQVEILSLFQTLKRKGKIRKGLLLTQSVALSSPILISNKEICLPTKAIDELKLIHIEAMLAHELGHVARKDYYWTCGITLLEILFFFQPLHQLVKKHLHNTTEILCDHWATTITGDNLALANCLVKVASWIKKSRPRPVLVAGMSLKKSALSNRIQSLINLPDMKKQRFNRLKIGLSFTSLLLFTLLILPGFTFTSFEHAIASATNDQSFPTTEEVAELKENTPLNSTASELVSITPAKTKEVEKTSFRAKEIPTSRQSKIDKPLETLVSSTPTLALAPIDIAIKKPPIDIPINIEVSKSLLKEKIANPQKKSTNNNLQENPPIEKNLPAIVKQTWVTQVDGQRTTPLGIELSEAAPVKIEIRKADNKSVVAVLVDEELEKGVHNFEWKHKNASKGDYFLVYSVQNHNKSQSIKIRVDGFIGRLFGIFGQWQAKRSIKELEKNIPFSGSLSPVKGKLPTVVKQTWTEQSENRTETPLGIELKEAATVQIEVKTIHGATIATVVNERLAQGMHHFEWEHKNIKKGTYLLSTTVNGQTISQRIVVKKVRTISKKEKYTCAELLSAVKDNDLEKVKRLVAKINPNCTYRGDGEPRSALNAAARKGNVAIGRVLLAADADISYKAMGDEGALMGAARYGHLDFVKLLVENGADVNTVIRGDGTALINSVRRGHYEVTEYLLQNGADISISVQGDESPLHHATNQGDKMLDLLLKYR